jgi:diguanylate cyclase (GGDEF)-like protein
LLVCVALALSRLVSVLLPTSIRNGALGAVLEIGVPAALCVPLIVLVAQMAKNKYLGETAQRLASERQAGLDVRRRDLATRLANAFEMAPTERAALGIAEEALERISGTYPAELLLADNSHAHLERVAVSQVAAPPACPVASPDECIAARRGHLQVFSDASEIDACPHLKCRGSEVASAVCVPVSVLGRTVGVLHSTTPNNHAEIDAGDQIALMQILANQLGLRLGMLRIMSETSLQASTDSLTGLCNRRRLESMFASLFAQKTPVALVLADLDDFKDLNDRHGHDAGDRALRAFASALRSEVRPSDIVCRYGGEEFVVVLPACSAEDAHRVFERVKDRVAAIGDDGRLPRFTASYGITDSDGTNGLEDLISEADAALYEAKADGKNRLVSRVSLQAVVDIDIDDEDGPRRRII